MPVSSRCSPKGASRTSRSASRAPISGNGAAADTLLDGLLTSSLDSSPLADRETVDQFHAAALAAGGRTYSACSARAMMGIA